MAEAMADQLDNPVAESELLAAVEPYRLESSVAGYLAAMGLAVV
jgi:hypothetical protein